MMNDFNRIRNQLNKPSFQPRSGRWVTLPELKSEDDFTDDDAVLDQPQVSDMSFSTIIQQVNKKGISKKSKRDRIVKKSVLLADRVGI
jgi:hypothetical protein